MELYAEEGMTRSQIKECLPQVSINTVITALNALLKKGYVCQSAKYEPYTITDAGRDALNGGKPWIPPTEKKDDDTPPAAPAKQGRLLPGNSKYHEAGL